MLLSGADHLDDYVLLEGVQTLIDGEPHLEPKAVLKTVEERPVVLTIVWPTPASEDDQMLIGEMVKYLGAAFFERALGGE